MVQGRKDQVVRDQIQARLRQGDDARDIAREMGVNLSTVYDVRRKDMGIHGRGTTLTIPGDSPDDAPQIISMTPEQFAQLSPRGEDIVIAAMIGQDSLKKRLLRTIAEQGPFDNVLDLCRAVRGGPNDTFGTHEVTHILKNGLNKPGLIRYRLDRSNSAAGAIPRNITITEAGYRALDMPVPTQDIENKRGAHPPGWSRQRHAVGRDMTEPRYHDARAAVVVGETERMTVAPTPVNVPRPAPVAPVAAPAPRKAAGQYPILTALRESFAARAEADARASRMADAAALIEADDPEEAKRLLDKAIALSPAGLTDIEKEFLRYAEEHPE